VNGLLCAPRDAKNLEQQMKTMLAMSSSELQQMGKAGRQWVQSNFDEMIVIDKYREALAVVLSK